MKKLFAILMLGAVCIAYSQKNLSTDYAYKVSEPYKVFDAKEKLYFAKGNEVMALKFDGKEVIIQKFNSDTPAFVKEKLYEKYFPKNYQVEDVLEINGNYYFFFSSWDGDNQKEQLFSIQIDYTKGEFIGSPKLLFQVNGKVTGSPMNLNNSLGGGFMWFAMGTANKFDFMQSNDRKHILIQYRKKPLEKKDTKSTDIIGLYTYDGDLTKIFGNEVTMPYTERRMDNMDYQLDDQGNLYLLAKVFHDDSNKDKKNRKDTEANYHLELFLIKSGSDKIQITKFENKDKFINKLWLFDTDKDYLICSGFYSNKEGSNSWLARNSYFDDVDGIALFKIKKDGTIYDENFHEIPTEVLNQYESARTVRKNERKERKGESAEFKDLELRDIAINTDGSVILVGEQYFTIYHQSYGGGGMGMGMGGMNSGGYYTYHYCDLLVTKINADGKLGWMKKVPKNQVGKNGQGGMSYKYFNTANNHFLVFYDNVKNFDLPLDKEPKQHSDGQGGYLTAVKISDADGTLKKGSILNSRDVEDFKIYQFATKRIVKTSEDSFLLEVYKKQKEDIMIKVVLK